ncbi:MAG: alpha/beta fold hydrolase [Gemmatimonadaceae bacterium]
MKRLVPLLAALATAGLGAFVTFVGMAAFHLGFYALAALALGVFWVIAWLLLPRAARRVEPDATTARRLTRWTFGLGTVAYIIIAQLAVGLHPARTIVPPEPVPGTQFWQLSNGSRIAYVVTRASEPRKAEPVIVLHDGLGVPMLPRLQRFASRPFDVLAEEGHDVFYYDQLGSGLSARIDLGNDAPYSVDRHVQDLEAIRQALGAPRVILLGEGWGATLAVEYAVSHPENVASMILESPGPVWYPAWPNAVEPAARATMTDVEASALALLQRPTLRLAVGRMMSDFNSRVAHEIVPDWEADQWWTRYQDDALRKGQPKVSCASATPEALLPLSGLGFFSYSYTLRDALHRADPRPRLKTVAAPTVIIRGSCDYTDWRVSYEYLTSMKSARYVAIPAAGHLIWLDQRSLHDDVLRAFIRGEALPLEFYDPRTHADTASSGDPRVR